MYDTFGCPFSFESTEKKAMAKKVFCDVAEVMGSNPVESPEFFRFMRQLLKLSSKCEDHIFI